MGGRPRESHAVYHIASVVIVDDKATKNCEEKRAKTLIGAGNVRGVARSGGNSGMK